MHAEWIPLRAIRSKLTALQKKVSWLFDELSDNNVSDDGLSLATSVAINEQISPFTIQQHHVPFHCDQAFY